MDREQQPWQEHEPGSVVEWQPATPPLAVEGPLELACFADQTLVLDLADDQIAFLEIAGRLKRVFLDGLHRVPVGHGSGQASPEGRLLFVRSAAPLTWRWQDHASLCVETSGTDGQRLALRGVCSVVIEDPVVFHTAVLQGLEVISLPVIQDVLDTLVRAQLESRLRSLEESNRLDPLRAQVMLGDLKAEDLAEDLAELGLGCCQLAAYTPIASEESAPETVCSTPAFSYDDVL